MLTTCPKAFTRALLLTLPLLASATHVRAQERSPATLDEDVRRQVLDCTFDMVADRRTRGLGATREGQQIGAVSGKAFCFREGELATAAHVLEDIINRRLDPPTIIDRAGRRYSIGRILRFSRRDDIAVFSLASAPRQRAMRPYNPLLEPNTTVHFAGRVPGGAIDLQRATFLRLTDATDDLGRVNWIVFGPAPSPGTSGSALLDAHGNVIGLIARKESNDPGSPAYAAPIAYVAEASETWADISSTRPLEPLGVQVPEDSRLVFMREIALPAAYETFAHSLIQARDEHLARAIPAAMTIEGRDAPLDDAARASFCAAFEPGHCGARPYTTLVRSASTGCHVMWTGLGAELVRCYGRSMPGPEHRGELAPPPPCRSSDLLEPPFTRTAYHDAGGTTWQVRQAVVRSCAWTITSMTRELDDGSLTLVRGAPFPLEKAALVHLESLVELHCTDCGSKPAGRAASFPPPSPGRHRRVADESAR